MTTDELLARLESVEARLARHAEAEAPAGLTDADEPTGERWEAGQVWAHMAEFVPYWHREAERVLAAPPGEAPPFGRVKTDAGRIAAIERDRHQAPAALMQRVRSGLAELRSFVSKLAAEDWAREGTHQLRGRVSVLGIVERFELAHLEEHADQLDGLAAG